MKKPITSCAAAGVSAAGPEQPARERGAGQTYLRLLRYLRPYLWPWFTGAVVAMLLFSASTGLLPLLVERVFDDIFAAKNTFVLNTSTVVSGIGGTVTFSNDAPFGALAGKAVAVEPGTGFTFDTAMIPRPASTKMIPRDN